MGYDSNLDAVRRAVELAVFQFDFESRAAGGGTVGEACQRIIAEDIHESAQDVQADPMGQDFPDNDDDYAEFKERVYGRTGRSYGFRTGQTLSVESLMGELSTNGKEATMSYGTGQVVTRSDGGNGYVGDSDRDATDVEKMGYLMDSGRQAIDVYKVGPYAEARAAEAVADALSMHLKEKIGD